MQQNERNGAKITNYHRFLKNTSNYYFLDEYHLKEVSKKSPFYLWKRMTGTDLSADTKYR